MSEPNVKCTIYTTTYCRIDLKLLTISWHVDKTPTQWYFMWESQGLQPENVKRDYHTNKKPTRSTRNFSLHSAFLFQHFIWELYL